MTKATYSEPYDPIVELVKINPVPSILIDMKTLSVAVINQAALKLLGYSEDEMTGKPITTFVPLDDIAAIQKSADEPPPEGETRWRCITKEAKSYSLKSSTEKRYIGGEQRVSLSLSRAAQSLFEPSLTSVPNKRRVGIERVSSLSFQIP